MIITSKEGNDLATRFLAGFCTGFTKNNHSETLSGFFAEKVSWKWSDGEEGEGRPGEVISKLTNSWGAACSYCTHSKPIVCVDTDQGRVVTSFQVIANLDGRLGDESTIVINNLAFILLLDKEKKVKRWNAIWNNNQKETLDAFAKLSKKTGVEMPKPKAPAMPITLEEGEAFAAKYLKAVRDGFKKNNHAELCRDIVADYVSWDWSDGSKDEGTYEEYFDNHAKGWGSMVDSWIPVDPMVTVDTNNSIVLIAVPLVLNVTGGFSDENNPVHAHLGMCLHLDEDHKQVKSHLCWDNNEPTLKAAVAKVAKRLEESNKAIGIALGSAMAGVVTGQ